MNADVSAGTRPARARSVHLVSGVWALAAYAILLNVAADEGGQSRMTGQVAGTIVRSTVGEAGPILRALGAVMLIVLTLLFWCGVRQALLALVGVALILLVLPGVPGITEAVCLVGALVLGTVPLLLDDGLAHVSGRTGA